MARISIKKGHEETLLTVSKDENLYDAMAAAGLIENAPCGGNGTCGKCKVEVLHKNFAITKADEQYLLKSELEAGIRLACKIAVTEDIAVRVLNLTQDFGGVKVLLHNTQHSNVAFALDIGTTTMEAMLVDKDSAQPLVEMVKLNPQKAFGADVFTRLNYSLESDKNRETLKNTVIRAINDMIVAMCDAINMGVEQLSSGAISANTTMIHMLLGIKVDKLAFAPFKTDFLAPEDTTGRALGLIAEGMTIHLSPASSSFIGGDITAGAVALDIDRTKDTNLFIDFGTNGEMLLASNDKILGCSVAAGPAFEGAEIDCGMSALAGAISTVHFNDEDIVIETVESKPACGICGSGLVDVVAGLLNSGLIDKMGKLATSCSNKKLDKHLKTINGMDCFVLDDKANVYISQKDIRNFQLAKAAMRTGIAMLLSKSNVKGEQIDTLYIAGGFGAHLDKTNLYTCGALPFLHHHIKVVGNTSLKGAVRSVTEEEFALRVLNLSKKVEVFLLSKQIDFQNQFVDNMLFD